MNTWRPLENCMLSDNIMDYYVVSQGKTTIPGVDDGEEMVLADVRPMTMVLVAPCAKHE